MLSFFKEELFFIFHPQIFQQRITFDWFKGHAANFVRFLEQSSLQAKVDFYCRCRCPHTLSSDTVVSLVYVIWMPLNFPILTFFVPLINKADQVIKSTMTGLHTVLTKEYYQASKLSHWLKIISQYALPVVLLSAIITLLLVSKLIFFLMIVAVH